MGTLPNITTFDLTRYNHLRNLIFSSFSCKSQTRRIMFDFRFFDRSEPVSVIERKLPHWSQSGVICFITFRAHDSMPKAVVETFLQERNEWLLRLGIDPKLADWKSRLAQLGWKVELEFLRHLSDRWNDELDNCHGACVLRDPNCAHIVGNSLRHFDSDRYELTDYVVMPNHVHVLVAFPDEESLLKQCESWKHFTATKINRRIGSSGRYWQQDGFDHLLRSDVQFEYLRNYIADNPVKAKLKPDEFLHFSKDLKMSDGES